MELLTPGVGLIFWQAVVFLILLFLLRKMAWKPILSALKIREESIEEALNAAEEARNEMEKLQATNEKLLDEARQEREKILKEARQSSIKLIDDAKADASKVSEKMIDDAKAAIQAEKNAAMADVKNQVTELSLLVTEKVLRKQLAGNKEQEALISDYVKDLNLN